MNRLGVGLFLVLLVGTASPVVLADSLLESDIYEAIPQVSIASRFEQGLDHLPASVTVIDRALIEASGAQNWADIFRLVPGFQSYSVTGNRYGVSYHGFGKELPNRLEVMVDGRSVYDPIFSSVQWNTLGINLGDIDRIEIVRGSSTASQGSNALLGAVNIITREPLQDTGSSLRLTSGSRSTTELEARNHGALGGFNYRLGVGYRHNHGFPSVPQQGPMKDGQELFQFNGRGTWTPNLKDEFDFSFSYVHSREGLGDSDHPDEFIPARYYAHHQGLDWTRAGEHGSDYRLSFVHSSLRLSSADDLGLISEYFSIPPALVSSVLGVQDQALEVGLGSLAFERYDLEWSSHWLGSETWRGAWGLGGRSEYVRSEFLYSRDDKITEESFRFFSNNEWSPSHYWLVNFGLMVEDTHVGALVSPRVSVSYLPQPGQSLRLGFGRSERAPSISEANLEQFFRLDGKAFDAVIRAGDGLNEEQVDYLELGYYLQTSRLRLDLRLFREKARDGIDAIEEPIVLPIPLIDHNIKVTANSAEWETSGAELQLEYRPFEPLSLRLHYAYLDLESEFTASLQPQTFGDFNDSRPRHSGGLMVRYRFSPVLEGSVITYHQSDVEWRDGDSIETFTRTDARLAYQVVGARRDVKIELIGQNLGGGYSEFNQENVFESRLFVRAELVWH